jgi:hypothetical protein
VDDEWHLRFSRKAELPTWSRAETRRPAPPHRGGKGLDADDSPIADGQERGSGLIDFELVRPADDVHDDRYLITGLVEPQRLNPTASNDSRTGTHSISGSKKRSRA